jgi:hypothetical protein
LKNQSPFLSELQPELKQKDMDSLDKLSEWIDALKTCFLSLSTCLAEKKCPLIDWVQAHKQTTAKLAQNMHENDIKTRHEEKLLECLSIIEQYAGNYDSRLQPALPKSYSQKLLFALEGIQESSNGDDT